MSILAFVHGLTAHLMSFATFLYAIGFVSGYHQHLRSNRMAAPPP
jgi:hypothetical protein